MRAEYRSAGLAHAADEPPGGMHRQDGSSEVRELSLYQDDSGLWIAESAVLPGLRAKGATREEAIMKIASALRLYDPCRCENDGDENTDPLT